jgi:predicted aspartyl protease
MRGYIDEGRLCRAEITVIGGWQTIFIEGIIDQGFNGDLCLPTQIAAQLGLVLCGLQRIELADGTKKKDLLFAGEAIFDGERKWVEIFLTDSEDALIGAGLLLDHILTIDYVDQTVEITRKE